MVTYGEVVSNEAVGEGVAQVMMGKSLMFLQDLLIYVKRYDHRAGPCSEARHSGCANSILGRQCVVARARSIYAVVLNIMQQLGALFTPNGRNVVGLDVRNVHYTVRDSAQTVLVVWSPTHAVPHVTFFI